MTLKLWQERESGASLYSAKLSEMSPAEVYGICKLRQDVFVLEQGVISEPELDGVDLIDTTTLIWWQKQEVLATIRVITEETHFKIGRLATAKSARNEGYGKELMLCALAVCAELDAERQVIIHAQAYLQKWYESMGFIAISEEFMEAGIKHIKMLFQKP